MQTFLRSSKNGLGADGTISDLKNYIRAPTGAQHVGFKSEMPAAKKRVRAKLPLRADPFFGRGPLGFETNMLCPHRGAYYFFQIGDGPGPSQPGKGCPLRDRF